MSKKGALERLIANFFNDDSATAKASRDGAKRVGGKYGKLRKSPYKLFRATNPTFIFDLESLPEFWRMCGHELQGALLGDAHPENLGAVGASAAEAQIDCTDFDVVAQGPLARDLSRAACGLAIAADQNPDKDTHALPEAPSEKALARVRLFSDTWVDRLLQGQGGLPDAAAFAQHLAAVDTPIDEIPLDESTHEVSPHPGEAGIAAAFESYVATTPAVRGGKFLRAWMLHGKGASSFCVDRTILRISIPSEIGPPRERLVEWKPQPDAPSVCMAFRERRNPATLDPFLGVASMGGVGHVAQRWLSDAQKVKSKDLHGAYADDVARLFAVRLADLHRRFTPAILERVRGQPAVTIGDSLVDLVGAYFPVLAEEWRGFLSMAPEDLARRVAEAG
jgi:hypothetical protein